MSNKTDNLEIINEIQPEKQLDNSSKTNLDVDLNHKVNKTQESLNTSLHLPGYILHISQIVVKKNLSNKTCPIRLIWSNVIRSQKFKYRWATNDEFETIQLKDFMLLDHLPNKMNHALNYFKNNNNANDNNNDQ